jgi:hypothetical protein
MYRLELVYDLFPEEVGHYGVRELTEETFVSIATGTPVPADIEAERIYRNRPGDAKYTKVWDPENNVWVNNLTEEQARAVYKPWWRADYP